MKMREIGIQARLMATKIGSEVERTLKDEQGDIGIKQLAITVGIIILVGVVVVSLKDFAPEAIEKVWDWLWLQIQAIGA